VSNESSERQETNARPQNTGAVSNSEPIVRKPVIKPPVQQPKPQQRPATPTYITVFEISNPEDYRDDNQKLLDEIRKFKPYVHVKYARINEKHRLVIATADEEAEKKIKGKWNSQAFGGHEAN
jgi:hypothetical protein